MESTIIEQAATAIGAIDALGSIATAVIAWVVWKMERRITILEMQVVQNQEIANRVLSKLDG